MSWDWDVAERMINVIAPLLPWEQVCFLGSGNIPFVP